MHAFIVRPFGTKNGIHFDRVDRELIRPALDKAGFSGGTTGEIIAQGNIRADMFEQLLIADFVIADISIHNANAFYELGIRHAFRDKRTFLIRAERYEAHEVDEVPFDLKTDRYMSYDALNPAAHIPELVQRIQTTWDLQKPDSPVFQLLPGLTATDPTTFLIVPLEFREEVEQAEATCNRAKLQLLSAETEGFSWKTMGLRFIGNTQRSLSDWPGSQRTWETIRTYDAMDLKANTMLGTVYQRQGDLVRSDQALKRTLEHDKLKRHDRAEILALMGRNAKTRWEQDWQGQDDTQVIQQTALASSHLQQSFEYYNQGFIEDRNHFYSGLNALATLTVILELAALQPATWEDGFDTEEEAVLKLKKFHALQTELNAGVKLAVESRRIACTRENGKDIWAEIGYADWTFLNSTKPTRVRRAYQDAFADAKGFERSAALKQAKLFHRLGIYRDNAEAALSTASEGHMTMTPTTETPYVLLFTGHRIDAEGREQPRFPPKKETQARDMIKHALLQEQEKRHGPLLGISGGASGGDILFHEVCRELEIPTRIYLAIPKPEYIKASVADAGPQWVERFNALVQTQPTETLSDSNELPRWLRAKKHYNIWQRSNLWMLYHALEISQNNLTLLALWNGEAGDDAGGTEDMVKRVKERGGHVIHLDARTLLDCSESQ
ncbi:MAG: hypothetical protein NPIRA02_28320 [Nitrospirales bacterium]|nr:MAG: hypothetical protein NPIRA02_28320 [Nitrospirales bacterium]